MRGRQFDPHGAARGRIGIDCVLGSAPTAGGTGRLPLPEARIARVTHQHEFCIGTPPRTLYPKSAGAQEDASQPTAKRGRLPERPMSNTGFQTPQDPELPSPSVPLHVGVTPWEMSAEMDAESLGGQVERAESLGFDSFWLPEHHFGGAGSVPAPLLLLAGAATRTRRLALATTSLLLPVRHPLHVAAEVAVLDHLSGGRLILGLGRGFAASLFHAFEVPPREKRDRFEAAVRRMREAWAGQPVCDAEGKPVLLSPLPLQRPHPPLWVAAFGPKALAQAGRLGLPYLASPIETLTRLEGNYATHREQSEAAGVETPPEVPVMRSVFAHPDVALCARVHEALSRQAATMSRSRNRAIQGDDVPAVEDFALVGEPAAVADGIAHYRERLGLTHLVARVGVTGLASHAVEASLEELATLRERL